MSNRTARLADTHTCQSVSQSFVYTHNKEEEKINILSSAAATTFFVVVESCTAIDRMRDDIYSFLHSRHISLSDNIWAALSTHMHASGRSNQFCFVYSSAVQVVVDAERLSPLYVPSRWLGSIPGQTYDGCGKVSFSVTLRPGHYNCIV